MSNPAFTRSDVFNGRSRPSVVSQPSPYGQYGQGAGYGTANAGDLQAIYSAPSAGPVQTGRMTYDDVLIKSVGMFAVMLVGATVGWLFVPSFPQLYWPTLIVGVILGFVNSLKREPSPILISLYAITMGIAVGGISVLFESMWSGIVLQAVLATLAVFGSTLALFASGKVRVSARATRIVAIALLAYFVYSVVNVLLVVTGASRSMFGLDTGIAPFGIPLGLILGPIVILMGAYCLVMSFDFIKRGVEGGAPVRYAWTAAFGLLMDVIFLYIQILRLLAILRSN
jgi:uncharacterized YccA/Bax inhibitor family protein